LITSTAVLYYFMAWLDKPTTALWKNIPQEYFYAPQGYGKTPHRGLFWFRKVRERLAKASIMGAVVIP